MTTREVDLAIAEAPHLDFYRCNQVSEEELVIHAVPCGGGGFEPEALSARLRAHFEVQKVRVLVVPRLDPEPSLKFRLTECQIAVPPEAP